MSEAADSPRLRIAVLSRVFSVRGGGAESYSVRIAQELAARHEVHVFAQEAGPAVPGVQVHRVGVRLRKPRWINQLLFAWATRRLTRGFDVVHSHENVWHADVHTIHVKTVRHGLLAGRRGLRLALRWLKIATSPRLLAYLALEAARFAPAPGRQVVLASEWLRPDAAAAYPQSAARLQVVTPGVQWPLDPPGQAQARAALGLPADAPLLLFVANDFARKGLETLLQALAQLPPEVQLAVAGGDRAVASWQARARAAGVAEGRIHWLGPQQDLAPAYRAADLLVHPTREDSFAMVALEAMAHGTPVVVSPVRWCGLAALLQHGRDAWVLDDPHDAAGLARAIGAVLADAALREHLAQGGQALARQHGWAAAAAAYEAIYRASLAQRRQA